MNDQNDRSGQDAASDDLFIVELDTRLELGVPVIQDDLEGNFNTWQCSNNGNCSGQNNGGNCYNQTCS